MEEQCTSNILEYSRRNTVYKSISLKINFSLQKKIHSIENIILHVSFTDFEFL